MTPSPRPPRFGQVVLGLGCTGLPFFVWIGTGEFPAGERAWVVWVPCVLGILLLVGYARARARAKSAS